MCFRCLKYMLLLTPSTAVHCLYPKTVTPAASPNLAYADRHLQYPDY